MAAGSAGGARTIRPTTVALQWPTIAWGLNVHVTMPSWAVASRQLTIIRPPHISRSALAIRHLPACLTSNLPEKCRIPERRKQIRPRRH